MATHHRPRLVQIPVGPLDLHVHQDNCEQARWIDARLWSESKDDTKQDKDSSQRDTPHLRQTSWVCFVRSTSLKESLVLYFRVRSSTLSSVRTYKDAFCLSWTHAHRAAIKTVFHNKEMFKAFRFFFFSFFSKHRFSSRDTHLLLWREQSWLRCWQGWISFVFKWLKLMVLPLILCLIESKLCLPLIDLLSLSLSISFSFCLSVSPSLCSSLLS